MLEISESPDKLYSLFAGDATDAYTYGFSGEREIHTGKKVSSYMYPGLTSYLDRLGAFYKDMYRPRAGSLSKQFQPGAVRDPVGAACGEEIGPMSCALTTSTRTALRATTAG